MNSLLQAPETNLGRSINGKTIAELQEEARARAEALKPQYLKKYGFEELERWQVREIERAEEEAGQCEGCKGEPCSKTCGCKYMFPIVRNIGGKLSIASARCKWGELRKLRSSCKRSCVPLKYAEQTFDDYQVTAENRDAVQKARWYVDAKPKKGMYIYGGAGTGKTFLASLIAREYILNFSNVVFGDVPSLLGDLKATFGTGNTEDLLNRYIDCDLLVLDDIGTEQVSDWSASVLYRLVNGRYNADKPIIVTSNYDLNGLSKRLKTPNDDFVSTRIISRFKEMCYQAFLGTKDRRG